MELTLLEKNLMYLIILNVLSIVLMFINKDVGGVVYACTVILSCLVLFAVFMQKRGYEKMIRKLMKGDKQ